MIRQLLEQGIGPANPAAIRPLLGAHYRQHNPRVSDGPSGLLSFVASLASAAPEDKVRVEILRTLEQGEHIVEHWIAWEAIPKTMRHTNGML